MALIIPPAYADTIELSNGKTMEGTFIGREGDTIKFESGGINMSFEAKDVKNIAMGSTKPAQSQGVKQASTAVMPAGSSVTIRLTDTLDSGKHATGHKFTAVLEGSLVTDGVTVVQAGSKVYGVISEAVKARRIAGNAKLMIALTDINIDGQIRPVSTGIINATTQATAASSAGKAVRGAAIGALANGSSGARTGARVGAGAAILSGGNQVVIPAGTLLDFKLSQPLAKK